ncbi:TPA: glycosyltransferase [Raoultella ornithinolytica]|nr:glycosyltransferase [Raoultella ornithinolytica]HEQ3490344.1 glycosyltransferase [Raoultella ornithinolytica]
MKELVTVYIITYNRLPLLKRAVESVRRQSYSNLEIIIVDDFSTDGTKEYLHGLSNEDDRVKYFINSKNSGACFSRNVAINNSKGVYVTGLDDDDYFMENRISNFIQESYLLDDYCFIYNENLWKNGEGIKKTKINRYFPSTILEDDLLFVNFVGNQIFTKTDILKSNNFDVDFLAWQDLECWYRILKSTKKPAKKINTYDYVQDISHEYGRISTARKDKIYRTLGLFREKHNLNSYDTAKLKSHLFTYGIKTINFIPTSILLVIKYKMLGCLISLRNFREMIR